MIEQAIGHFWVLGPVVLVTSFLLSWGLIMVLRPWLARRAMARPTARSSHREPTPQGGGIAVVIATFTVAWAAIALLPSVVPNQSGEFLALTGAAALLAVVGAIDDMHTLPEAPRLALQFVAVGIAVAALPSELQILPQMPWWLERTCLFFGLVWLVNVANFMDGIDWMTVAEVVPLAGALVLLGAIGTTGLLPTLVAAALLGAILGFAPFNRPVARLFLGDAGSLPIGLLLGWLLLTLAGKGHLAAALILPLYYVADATVTLAGRLARRERIWQAHRTHFYQRATDNGFTVPEIVARVVLLNLALAALALVTVVAQNVAGSLAALAAGLALVAWLLATFASRKR
jgi:UDP-N-acetylmuramyl pentapeptide phosphotransferase/UDP-N-acetylglucosamine-1-phosphate transferase